MAGPGGFHRVQAQEGRAGRSSVRTRAGPPTYSPRPARIRWPATLEEARRLQTHLAPLLEASVPLRQVRRVAGVDLAYAPEQERAWAAVVVLALPDLSLVGSAWATGLPPFPYVPGYLSFREGPLIVEAVRRLRVRPDLWLFDGQGIAHPRGFGLAAHLGLVLGAPSVGCAKSRLVGTHREPGRGRGAWTPLHHQRRVVGAVLRTRANVRPLYVSIGHLIDLRSAIHWVLAVSPRFRVPEPIRHAERLVNRLKREWALSSPGHRLTPGAGS